MQEVRNNIANRYYKLCTMPRTQYFHQFIPLSTCILTMKRLRKPDLLFELDKKKIGGLV